MSTKSTWILESRESWTKNGTPICFRCGRFCTPADEQTPYGCADPGDPEPYDPEFFCDNCVEWLNGYWDRYFEGGYHYDGYWHKSKAEVAAAKKHKLVWVESAGKFGTSEYVSNQYLSASDCRLRKVNNGNN